MVRSKRDRYALLFWLDDLGVLRHCASGMAVAASQDTSSCTTLTLVIDEERALHWRLGSGSVIMLDREPHGALMLTVDANGHVALGSGGPAEPGGRAVPAFQLQPLAAPDG